VSSEKPADNGSTASPPSGRCHFSLVTGRRRLELISDLVVFNRQSILLIRDSTLD
jgi:hypothetical protein